MTKEQIRNKLELLYDRQLIASKQLVYLRAARDDQKAAVIKVLEALNEMIYELEVKLKESE